MVTFKLEIPAVLITLISNISDNNNHHQPGIIPLSKAICPEIISTSCSSWAACYAQITPRPLSGWAGSGLSLVNPARNQLSGDASLVPQLEKSWSSVRNSARIPALCHSQDPGVLHPPLSCSAGLLRANCQAGPLDSAGLQHIQLYCQRHQHRKLYGTYRHISASTGSEWLLLLDSRFDSGAGAPPTVMTQTSSEISSRIVDLNSESCSQFWFWLFKEDRNV